MTSNNKVSVNQYNQPIGLAMPEWTSHPYPSGVSLSGTYCRIEPLSVAQHGEDLFEAISLSPDGRDWTYMFCGPFSDKADYYAYLEQAAASRDPMHYAIIDLATTRAVGTFSLMRVDPVNGVVEVGHVVFSDRLKKTRAATEAHYLLMKYVFDDLAYRRYEWKCDSLNAPSRQSALRLGFTFEGIFRQAIIYKGRTRDTAWFSILDGEWNMLKHRFQQWLDPKNFDAEGKQYYGLNKFLVESKYNSLD